MLIGVVSDTHGLVRPQLLKAFDGVRHILHAGDVGAPAVLEELSVIAPVNAVRGNVDRDEWADALPLEVGILLSGVTFLLTHERKRLSKTTHGFHVIVSGHSHRPSIEWQDKTLYLNPGSAGPRRFRLPVSAALIEIDGSRLHPRLLTLA